MAATSRHGQRIPEAADGRDGRRSGVDRRRLRTERGRELVVTALLEFFDEGESQPGAARIAERAGVSERSVFRYFDDLDALAAEAVARQIARTRAMFAAPDGVRRPRPPHPRPRRPADARSTTRSRSCRRPAAASRTGRRASPRRARPTPTPPGPGRRAVRRRARRAHRGRGRTELLDAADAAASFEQIDQLRAVAGWSRARTRAVVVRTLRALLAS